MQNPARASIIFPVLSLLALIAGGIFISSYWQTTVYTPFQSIEEENLAEEEQPEEPENIEELESEVGTVTEDLAEKTQELIKESEELIAKALARERSRQVKGVYMNEFVANSQSVMAQNTRENIKRFLEETELNGVVIDVKEAYGPNLPNSLKELIAELHQKNVWVIARICAFRDFSLRTEKPEWYLKNSITSTTSDEFWQDWSGGYWLDPASPEVQDYIIDFSKTVIDFGFDELQFDYIRFPSDGDLENIVYPVYNNEPKYESIRGFFLALSESLRVYKPSIILSVDLFGYVATQYRALDIGQRLLDAGDVFDYISFMLYPSHFYGGFMVGEDLKRELPALHFLYQAEDISTVVSNHPYEVVLRSVLVASDYLSLFGFESKIRPWLQDFSLKADTLRGILYDAEKVRDQIEGAEDADSSGWLLWNPSNLYTRDALLEAQQ